MSNWKEKLKGAQSGGESYPQFLKHVDLHLEIKADDNGKVGFKYYDRNEEDKDKRNKYLHKPITGMLIGSAMRLSSFDSNDNSQINSSLFYTYRDKGVVFSRGKVIERDNMANLKLYMASRTGDRVTNKRIYFVLTEKGSLLEITTNIGLSITDEKRIKAGNPDVMLDNMIIFTPKEFDFSDGDYSEKDHEGLGNFAKKNKPKYCKLTVGDVIPDNVGEKSIPVIDLYKEFMDATKAGEDVEAEHVEEEAAKISANTEGGIDFQALPPTEAPLEHEEEDDLPF